MPLLRRETDHTSVEYRPTPLGSGPTANRPGIAARTAPQLDPRLPIQRLLLVADAAVEVDGHRARDRRPRSMW